MDTWLIILLIVIGVLLIGGVIFMILYTLPIAKKLYKKQWIRGEKDKFARGCSDASVDYHLDMYNQGLAWRDENLSSMKEVEINSLNTKLVGEYFDFGFKKAIILSPGRTECCHYACYYAETFKKAGFNILTIDPRAHGLSEGDKITLGKLESIDLINWAKFLNEKFGVEKVTLYGLCGGATASLLAKLNDECPAYLDSLICDGMFYSFFDVYKRHIIDEKHPVYPVIWEVMSLIKKGNDVNPYKMAPNKLIKKINCPILILSGSKDKFAVPEEARKMFDSCPSSNKKFVLINEGRHSHLRYNNKIDYEIAVINFLQSI